MTCWFSTWGGDGGKLLAYVGTVDAGTSTGKVVIRAFPWCGIERCHPGGNFIREVDLKRTAHILHITHKLEESLVILRTTSDQVHSIPICRANLYTLTAIVESFSKVFRNEEVC